MSALDVVCPTCEADVDKRCRTLTTGRTTDTHAARFEEALYVASRAAPRRSVRVEP